MEETSGDVYAFERLDREKKAEYELTALIIDRRNNQSLEPPSKFIIKVYDINDNIPVFVQKVFNGSVPEMSPVGTFCHHPFPFMFLVKKQNLYYICCLKTLFQEPQSPK